MKMAMVESSTRKLMVMERAQDDNNIIKWTIIYRRTQILLTINIHVTNSLQS